jgi:hypothetical protein
MIPQCTHRPIKPERNNKIQKAIPKKNKKSAKPIDISVNFEKNFYNENNIKFRANEF